MVNYAAYKSKNKIINKFLLFSNVIITIDLEEVKRKYNSTTIELDGAMYRVFILPNIRDKTNIVKIIVQYYLNIRELSDVLFTNIRLDINNKLFISNKLNICLHYLNNQDKITLILLQFYKIKDIIKKYRKEKVLFYYNMYNENHSLNYIRRKVTINIDDYCYIGSLNKLIKAYQKEINYKLDTKNPSLSDNMIIKYLDNYFSKVIVISYDDMLVKNFLSKYYITDEQSQDNVKDFIDNIIFTYKEMTGLHFTYENKYNYNHEFRYNLAKKCKFRGLDDKLDEVFLIEENYNNVMFMFEILEVSKHHSTKKQIINYITAIELLLTHSPKNEDDTTSKQFINKVLECLKKEGISDFSNQELKYIYTYRSKIVHGDYKAIEKNLKKLSKFRGYDLDINTINNEIYLTKEQLIEEVLEERVMLLFKTVFNIFLKNYNYINYLKQKIID